MEILALAVVALVVGHWIRSAVKSREYARGLALQRPEFSARKDVFLDTWTYDFAEMQMVYEFSVFDYPPIESNDLYEIRRRDGPAWESRLHRDAVPHLLARLERDTAFHRASGDPLGMWTPEYVAKTRASITAAGAEWRPVDERHAAQLETAYQMFLHHKQPVVPPVSMYEYWTRLVAMENERERRQREMDAERARPPAVSGVVRR